MFLKKVSIVFITHFICFIGYGQLTFKGTIYEADGATPIHHATITDLSTMTSTMTSSRGQFELNTSGFPIDIRVSSFGYKDRVVSTSEIPFDVLLQQDPLLLESIVITDYQNQQNLLRSKNAISLIADPLDKSLTGISSLIEEVPGVFIDGSLGEVYTRVYTRGISASAEDDIGWFYQSLQEDGLPMTAIQYNYFTPDFFQRSDLMTQRMEALRGGKAGILFQNAPGGAFNFISSSATTGQNRIKMTYGQVGEQNPYYRLDGLVSIPLAENWGLALSGLYRHDEGHRNVDYPWNRGGQLKAKLQHNFSKGVFSTTLKYLNDHVNRHTGLSATNWQNPTAAFGQDFRYTALMLPEFNSNIPGPAGYDFKSSNGIHVKDIAIQPKLAVGFSGWNLDINTKYAYKHTDWNTSFANQPLGLESFLPYFLSGGQFPFGLVSFDDINTGERLATVNNFGALNAFEGRQPTFEYVEGALPNDALMGIAPWRKNDKLHEVMGQVGLSKSVGLHDLNVGAFLSYSDLTYATNASYAFATFEPEPRLLQTTLSDFDGNTVALSDRNGLSNLGGLFFESGSFDINQFALHANDNVQITEKLSLDIGLRYEHISHQGELDVPGAIEQFGGLDGNPLTDYDNGQQAPSGFQESLDFTYDYLSFSGALGYSLFDNQELFIRYTRSNKAPELNTYIQNFSGLPITEPGQVQGINQLEASYRISTSTVGASITAFSSELKNIAVSDFLFDQQTNEIFYSPVQLNNTRTSGIELEWSLLLSDMFIVRGNQTYQTSKASTLTVYNANGSADTTDDSILDFSGNEQAHTPKLMSRLSAELSIHPVTAIVSWHHMGTRFGNAENSFTLPSYHTFNVQLNSKIGERISLGLEAKNVLNSAGLMNFFGPNEFGSSANAATQEYIQNNPDASFVVFPILPRSYFVTLTIDL